MSLTRSFKFLLLFFFIIILAFPGGCESDREEEGPSPDPEPGQQQEEMVQDYQDDLYDRDGQDDLDDLYDQYGWDDRYNRDGQNDLDDQYGWDDRYDKDDRDESVPGEDPLGLEPGQAVRRARLTLYSEDGSTRWEVRSEEAVRREREAEITLQPVLVDSFLDENGSFAREAVYDLRGEEGIYLEDEQVLTLKGEAQLESGELLFLSSNISWQQRENLIFSREGTIIKGKSEKKFTASGQGFQAEADLSRFHLQGSAEEKARIVWEGNSDERNNF